MKERPILFKAEMVRAILAGDKTQTRRAVKPAFRQDVEEISECPCVDPILKCIVSGHSGDWEDDHGLNEKRRCPYGVPGDLLWVKETFRVNGTMAGPKIRYAADDAERFPKGCPDDCPDLLADDNHWRPSIFMRRYASRLTLQIDWVRVELLNDITEDDAIAEGMEPWEGDIGAVSARQLYECLWDEINGTGSWAKNPWVWVIGFRRVVAT